MSTSKAFTIFSKLGKEKDPNYKTIKIENSIMKSTVNNRMWRIETTNITIKQLFTA